MAIKVSIEREPKKAPKYILIGIAVILTPFLLLLVLYLLLVIGFNWPYRIHRQAVLEQTHDVFKDENGTVYFVRNDCLYRFDEGDNKKRVFVDAKDENGDHLNKRGVIRDNNYFYYFLDDGNRGGQVNYRINVYDKGFNLTNTIILPDDLYVYGKCTADGKVYYLLSEPNQWTEGYKEKIEGKKFLYRYDPTTQENILLMEDVKKSTAIDDNGIKIYCNRSYHLQVVSEKASLDSWSEDSGKSHKYFADVIDIWFDNNNIYAKIGEEDYSFKKDNQFNKFCSKAFLIDNKVVFATYNYIKNKDCGSLDGYYCICKQGKAFLYQLDLNTKELTLTNEYEAGTFLIDYDLEGAKYYYDGGLYINNVFYRGCEKIEPGPIETKRGEGYFRDGEHKLDYYVSYLDGEFYGI